MRGDWRGWQFIWLAAAISPLARAKMLVNAQIKGKGLADILPDPSQVHCGDDNFDSLVVELGASESPSEDPCPYLQKIVAKAEANHTSADKIHYLTPGQAQLRVHVRTRLT